MIIKSIQYGITKHTLEKHHLTKVTIDIKMQITRKG